MYLVFDTETNGKPRNYKAPMQDLDNWPRITQLAWALYGQGGVLFSSASSLVKPDGWEVPTEQFFIDNNMSTERCEKEGLPLSYLLDHFLSDLNKCEFLIAHNISFDYNVLGAELLRKGMKSGKKVSPICTMKSSTSFCKLPGLFGGHKWPKLEELHEVLFGVKPEGSHDALYDVEVTARCFFELKRLDVIKLPKSKNTLLQEAKDYCDRNEKSTEFMLQYMQDVAGVDPDTVLKFLKPTFNQS